MSGGRRIAGISLGTVAALAFLLLLSFAVPLATWRTGRMAAPPLELEENGPAVAMSRRVWVDTDAACGQGGRVDPDDCIALFALARFPGIDIVGISTVFGNAPLEATDATTRELAGMLAANGLADAAVYRGSAQPGGGGPGGAPAHAAMRRALEEGPLTILALGPLTNVAAALRARPDLQRQVSRLVAVMGKRPGHLFHPSEGAPGGVLFGHGPVFRDLNFTQDPAAAASVLQMRLPISLVPYDAARHVELTGTDLDRLFSGGTVGEWIAVRARGWLDFWREDIGRDGFFPFDLLAAAYLIDPHLFHCARAVAFVSEVGRLENLAFPDARGMLVEAAGNAPLHARTSADAIYCPDVDTALDRQIRRMLFGLPG